MLSLLWRVVAGIAAALGFAIVARTYTEAPPEEATTSTAPTGAAAAPTAAPDAQPAAPAAQPDGAMAAPAAVTEAGDGAAGAAPAEQATRTELQPGWSRPKPDRLPRPTYWPMVFAFGLTFFFWGLISNLFVLGFGFIMFVIGLAGWIGDLLHEA